MQQKNIMPPKQSNQSSIRFQAQCSERVEQAISSNNPTSGEIMRIKNMLLGTLIVGSGLCLGGTALYLLTQNIK